MGRCNARSIASERCKAVRHSCSTLGVHNILLEASSRSRLHHGTSIIGTSSLPLVTSLCRPPVLHRAVARNGRSIGLDANARKAVSATAAAMHVHAFRPSAPTCI